MNGIQGLGSMQGMMGMMGMEGMRPTALTDDQKKQVASILSNYDPENMSAEDAKSIFQQFADAGIMGPGLKEAIEAAGFDAEELRTLGMPEMKPPPGGPGRAAPAELTDAQKETVASILSQYDADNLTTETAQSIFKQFKDAGITPAKGLKEAIEAAGFDAEKLRTLGMNQDKTREAYFWSIQNSITSVNASALQSLQSILNQYDFSNLSSDQETTLLTQLQSAGFLQTGSLLNIGA